MPSQGRKRSEGFAPKVQRFVVWPTCRRKKAKKDVTNAATPPIADQKSCLATMIAAFQVGAVIDPGRQGRGLWTDHPPLRPRPPVSFLRAAAGAAEFRAGSLWRPGRASNTGSLCLVSLSLSCRGGAHRRLCHAAPRRPWPETHTIILDCPISCNQGARHTPSSPDRPTVACAASGGSVPLLQVPPSHSKSRCQPRRFRKTCSKAEPSVHRSLV